MAWVQNLPRTSEWSGAGRGLITQDPNCEDTFAQRRKSREDLLGDIPEHNLAGLLTQLLDPLRRGVITRIIIKDCEDLQLGLGRTLQDRQSILGVVANRIPVDRKAISYENWQVWATSFSLPPLQPALPR